MGDTRLSGWDVVGLEDVQTLDSSLSGALGALAEVDATGELVCRCDRAESRVYMQRGRVAWANDSEHGRVFTAHLKEHASISNEAMEAVVAECVAEKLPIGEALVAKGLATEDQVRAALRHQIGLALHVGICNGDGRCGFATRDYEAYDERFTFEAAGIIAECSSP